MESALEVYVSEYTLGIGMSEGYPSNWDSRRRRVYKRDNYTCQNCGARGGSHGNTELHAHHIVPKSNGGTHQTSNLVTVCKQCHKAVHGSASAPTSSYRRESSKLEDRVATILEDIYELENESNQIFDNRVKSVYDGIVLEDESVNVEKLDGIGDILQNNLELKQKVKEYESLTKGSEGDYWELANWLVEETKESIQLKVELVSITTDFIEEAMNEDVECANCAEVIDAKNDYCKNCGKEIRIKSICPSCNEELAEDASFCPNCGYDIEEDDVEYDETRNVSEERVEEFLKVFTEKYQDLLVKSTIVLYIVEILSGSTLRTRQYCPNCGFMGGMEGGVAGKKAGCIVCGTVLENTSGDKWKIIDYELHDSDDSTHIETELDDELQITEIEELGKERYEQGKYENLLYDRVDNSDSIDPHKEYDFPFIIDEEIQETSGDSKWNKMEECVCCGARDGINHIPFNTEYECENCGAVYRNVGGKVGEGGVLLKEGDSELKGRILTVPDWEWLANHQEDNEELSELAKKLEENWSAPSRLSVLSWTSGGLMSLLFMMLSLLNGISFGSVIFALFMIGLSSVLLPIAKAQYNGYKIGRDR